VFEPNPVHVIQVNGEKLDDEQIIIRPACPAHKVVVLQPNARVGFAIILDDVVQCL
jgi:hypothetical protein